MLIERSASKKKQKLLVALLAVVVIISIGIATVSYRKTPDAIASLRPLPKPSAVAIPQQSSRNVIDDVQFKGLRAIVTDPVTAGVVGRSNPFSPRGVE
jgi:hypothetical protein